MITDKRISAPTRGTRWQLGVSTILALVWLAQYSLVEATLLGGAFYLIFAPAWLLSHVVTIPLEPDTVFSAIVVFMTVFTLFALLLVPLGRWIDEPDRRTRHAKVAALVALAYAISIPLILYGWVAASGR